MSTARKLVIAGLSLPLVLFAVLATIWAFHRPAAGEVANRVTIGGVDVGGDTRDQVAGEVEQLAEAFSTRTVTISTPEFDLTSTAGELGLSVDEGATTADVMRAGSDDGVPWGPIRFAQSWFRDRPVGIRVRVDADRAASRIAELEGTRRTDVSEPRIDSSGDAVVLVAGVDGRSLNPDAIIAALPERIDRVDEEISLDTEQQVVEPNVSDESVQALVDRANGLIDQPITIKVGERSTEVPGAAFRPGFTMTVNGDTPSLVVDPDHVGKVLAEQGGLSIANPTGVRFDLIAGVPTPIPGTDAQACCADDAARTLADALLAGNTEVTLGTRPVTAAEGVEWANTLGVKEVIGEFTTRFPCCPPRVTNIRRISDLTRGVIIAPGETFSVNDFVGRRTAEKGFVPAPVIEQGRFEEDIGGGVSQYATTLFNAAFFGGLDIPTHKAHSIYISRYPFGREATLAYPSVDLKIRNNTPHGVMIWPSYTNSSITVQLWSTRYVTGAQTGANKTGGCGPVRITRTRTWIADGRTDDDTFTANYNCNPPKD